MSKRIKITKGIYQTFQEDRSVEETHDIIQKALPGQSYVLETMHKVSTTQVTGDALMKVAVGGKGGFAAGTAGDVREQKQDLNADVVRMESKEVFRQRLEVYANTGQERDYDDFTYQAERDASDYMQNAEYYKVPGLEKLRAAYDETCGYRGAWKYVGLNGAEHRRYMIKVENTLNLPEPKSENKGNGGNFWEPKSYACHHNQLYMFMNLSYIYNDDSILDDFMMSHNNGHAGFIMWYLDKQRKDFNPDTWHVFDPAGAERKEYKPSEAFLKAKDKVDTFYRKKRLEVMDNAWWKECTRDWRIVYAWEQTKDGKTKFA